MRKKKEKGSCWKHTQKMSKAVEEKVQPPQPPPLPLLPPLPLVLAGSAVVCWKTLEVLLGLRLSAGSVSEPGYS